MTRPDTAVIDSLIVAHLEQHGPWTDTICRFARHVWPTDPMAALYRIEHLEDSGRIRLAPRHVELTGVMAA